MLCLMCSDTSVSRKEVVCFLVHCKLISATHTADNATCNIVALLYEGGLKRKQFCIKVGFMNNASDFLNMYCASYFL